MRRVNLPTGPTASRAISRSQSCSELRGDAASQSLRRSLSLNLLCKERKRADTHLDNQSASSPVNIDGSAQATHSEEEEDAAQSPPVQPESAVSGERSDLPPLTAPILNPREDAFPTESSSVRLRNRVVSANIEARRLKMKRDKKNSVKVCALTEEKL